MHIACMLSRAGPDLAEHVHVHVDLHVKDPQGELNNFSTHLM